MSNIESILVKAKPCFGKYENWDNSWHCKGCPIKGECEQMKKENDDNDDGCTEN